jgi:hypothetical protein
MVRAAQVRNQNVGTGLEGLRDEQDLNAVRDESALNMPVTKKSTVMLSSCPPQQFTGRTLLRKTYL